MAITFMYPGVDLWEQMYELLKYMVLPSTDSRRVVVSSKGKYVHEVLVNRLVKLAQEVAWLGELTMLTWPWLLIGM